jgi:hypothetical protein
MTSRFIAAAVAALALAAAAPAAATAGGEGGLGEERHAWYLPDQVKLQLAGNVGFVSPGLGYAFLDRRVESDVFLGWVPRAIAGTDVLSVTAKLTAQPFAVDLGGVEWRPFALAVQLTYTFGDQYFVEPPSRFPGGYYDFPTALRAGLAIGSVADVAIGTRRVGAYVELVALDLMLKAWAENRDTLGPQDVFSVAVGLRGGI